MKAYFSILVFAVLALSAVVTGTGNYIDARGRIASDLNKALADALAENAGAWVTTDTIKACKRLNAVSSGGAAVVIRDRRFSDRLSIPEIRDKSYVLFAVLTNGGRPVSALNDSMTIDGDTLIIYPATARSEGVAVALRAKADCSFATVFGLSDQRLPMAFAIMAMLWGLCSFLYMRKHAVADAAYADVRTVGGVRFDVRLNAFYNADNEEIHFTPMQFELMRMFFNADGHRLSKDEICRALWPGKDDASETLYTLVRRLKLVVGQNTNIRIEGERGRAYELKVEDRG